MDGGFAEDETEADIAQKVYDGLDIMAAFCTIESVELRRAVKRIVMALSGQANGKPDWSRLRDYAVSVSDPPLVRPGEADDD